MARRRSGIVCLEGLGRSSRGCSSRPRNAPVLLFTATPPSLLGVVAIDGLVLDDFLFADKLEPFLGGGCLMRDDCDQLDPLFSVDVNRLNRLAIGSVQDLSCRSNRNPWIAGTQMFDQDLGGLQPLALEDLAHFRRKLWPSPRVAGCALGELPRYCSVSHILFSPALRQTIRPPTV